MSKGDSRYERVSMQCNTDEGRREILPELRSIFKRLDEIDVGLMNGQYSEAPHEVEKLLIECNGLWAHLSVVYRALDDYKNRKQKRYYIHLRLEAGQNNSKFNSSAADREASAHVNKERRVRNAVWAYVETSDRFISSCQSLLRRFTESEKRGNV